MRTNFKIQDLAKILGIIILYIFFVLNPSEISGQIVYSQGVRETAKIEIEKYHLEITKLLNENPEKGIKMCEKAINYALSQKDYCNVGSFISSNAVCYIYLSKYNEAKEQLKKAEKYLAVCNTPSYIDYKITSAKYFIASDKSDHIAADSLLNKMIQHATNLKDTVKIAYANANRGSFLVSQGKSISAVEHYLKSIDLIGSKNDTNFLINVYASLTGCYLGLKNYTKGLEVANMGLNYAKNRPQHTGRITLLNNTGSIYTNLQDYKAAMSLYNESVQLCKENGAILSLTYALHGIGECYLKQDNYSLSEKYVKDALKIETENEFIYEQINSLRSLAEINLFKNNFNDTEMYINKAEKLISKHQIFDELIGLNKVKTKLYLKKNNLDEYNNYISTEKFQDSLLNVKQSIINDDLYEKYNTKIKETENLRLKSEQVLKEATINTQKKILIGSLIAFAVITLLSLLLYFQSNNRKVLNQTLSKQNDQIQLLHQELNHRVKNNLSFMTSLIEMQGRRTQNIEAREILQETENRLGALSLVHSNLFKHDEATTVNLAIYLQDLVSKLEKIFSIPGKELKIICDFTDHHVNAEDAMRLGLIVNELITNSVKHAFIHVEEPQIHITTVLDKPGKLTLDYKDNGPGHNHISNLAANETNAQLGTKLIALLREQMKDRYTVVC